MGKNNQRRRADKKRRAQRRATTDASARIRDARADSRTGARAETTRAIDEGQRRAADRMSNAKRWAELERSCSSLVARAWEFGWQPDELVRQVRRTVAPAAEAVAVIVNAIVADDIAGRGREIHPSWARQIERLVGHAACGPDPTGWIARWARSREPEPALTLLCDVHETLLNIERLPWLIPPPGTDPATRTRWPGWFDDEGSGASGSKGGNDPVLTKIRSLLAKAEASEFPSEAEAFTSKAYDMMTKHAIDEAVLRSRQGPDPAGREATALRLPLNEPYAKQHMLLLNGIATVSRCRTVMHPDAALATVIGRGDDLRRVELLFTSLMIQAQRALTVEAATTDVGGLQRSRRFRSSFLTGFAARVRDRLAERLETVASDAPAGVLPVLASDDAAAGRLADEMFGGTLKSVAFSVSSVAGLVSGRAAGDRAQLDDSGLAAGSSSTRGSGVLPTARA